MNKSSEEWRNQRLHLEKVATDEYRTPAQRDRDRIVHASAFVRLAGVTQVVPPGEEGYLLHNRMTHTIKVAQVARRMAERLLKEQDDACEAVGGVDPDVVETAALAHDLGHPPFGHIGEEALREAAYDDKLSDAFEGNAQTFRIVAKLGCRAYDYPGLNLTRATLNAILKYPWTRATGGGHRENKWSVYETEMAEFAFARDFDYLQNADQRKCAEAEIMDWADDIAYSVHDVEDFYRVGLIPLHRLAPPGSTEASVFLESALKRREDAGLKEGARYTPEQLAQAFNLVREYFPTEPYTGTENDRTTLRVNSKQMIGNFVRAIHIHVPAESHEKFVTINEEEAASVAILKELTWHYVIHNPALATQQHGQKHVVQWLYANFRKALTDGNLKIFPASTRDLLQRLGGNDDDSRRLRKRMRGVEEWSRKDFELHERRTVVDVLAGMTEQQILRLYQRMMGVAPGSALERMYL
jgi:dGTPase